jgi:hypothetical protein
MTHLNSRRYPLWARLLLLFLLEVAAALGIVLLVQIRPDLSYMGVLLFASAWLGLASGLGMRLLLKELHWMLQGLAVMVTLICGLLFLGLTTSWKYGLGPQEFKAFDLAGATQISTALLTSLLGATAWRKGGVQKQELTRKTPSRPLRAKKPNLAKPRQPLEQPKANEAADSQSKGETRRTPGPARLKTAQTQKPPILASIMSKPGRRARRPEVQLASTEDHRCPYCLEIVQPNDRRGIVECKICHTLHHADCWAITGTCQVPHLNT